MDVEVAAVDHSLLAVADAVVAAVVESHLPAAAQVVEVVDFVVAAEEAGFVVAAAVG